MLKYFYAEVILLKCLFAHVHCRQSALPIQQLKNVTFTSPQGLSNRCQCRILLQKRGFVATVPNQSQEKLPGRPTRPDNIGTPVLEHQSTSAAWLGRVRMFRFWRIAFDKFIFIHTIPFGMDSPDGTVETGAFQLDGVEVPSLYREETGSLQAAAARG